MTSVASDGREPAGAATGTMQFIPLDRLRPHPDNPNHMPATRLEKLVTHIRRNGHYEPLIVRPHPSRAGDYQILNGHHRAEALRALGQKAAACMVWETNDGEARLYLATLNRLSGADIPEKRAALLDALLSEIGAHDLAGLLPESTRELEELAALSQLPLSVPEPAVVDDATVRIDFRMTPDEAAEVTAALAGDLRAHPSASPSASLVAMARHYLACPARTDARD